LGSLARGLDRVDPATLGGAGLRPAPFARRASLWPGRVLGVPLLWKLFGANAIIVLGTAATVIATHVEHPQMWITMSAALLATFAVNGALVYLALRPLAALEEAAGRVSRGERNVRVPRSPLADRNMTRVGETINRLVDRLTADRHHMRKLAAQVITAGEEERARIARQLQDSSAQTLAALSLQASSAVRDCTDPAMLPQLLLIHDLTVDALEEIRNLAHTVYPRVLDDLGLPAALQWLARRSSTDRVAVSVELGDPVKLPREVEVVLYQVASEGVSNALVHGMPSRVVLSLTPDRHRVTLKVLDDGAGFDVGTVTRGSEGFGLFSMEERVSLVDGTFDVESAPGDGTRVIVSVPLPGAAVMDVIRVVLADDHMVVRAGLKAVLSGARDIDVVGEASNGKEAIALVDRLHPHVVVMDLSMAEMDGLTATRELATRTEPPKVLVLTMHGEEEYLVQVLEAGASGYLVKNAADRELVDAIRAVARGDMYVQPSAGRILAHGIRKDEKTLDDRARFEKLTERERDVLQLVAHGFTAPEIGEKLFISPKTVDTYKQRIGEKLGLTHRSDYVQFALKLGLLKSQAGATS